MEKINKTTSLDRVPPDPILLPNVTIYGNKSCFQCNFCDQKGVKANVIVHQLSCKYCPVEKPFSIYCEGCSFIFWYLRAYKQHCDQNTNCRNAKFVYVCDVCNAFLASKASFDRHHENKSHDSKHARKQEKKICKLMHILNLIQRIHVCFVSFSSSGSRKDDRFRNKFDIFSKNGL